MRRAPGCSLLLLLLAATACGSGSHAARRPAAALPEGSCPTVPTWGDFTLAIGGDAGTMVSGSYEATSEGKTNSVPLSGTVPMSVTVSAGDLAASIHSVNAAPAVLTLQLEQPYTLASAGACSAHAEVLTSTSLVWTVSTSSGTAALASKCSAPLLASTPLPPGLSAWPCEPAHVGATATPSP